MINYSKFLAIKIWQQSRLKVDWLDNLIITAGVVRDASDLIPFPYLKIAAGIVVQVLLKIQTVRRHVDDFRDLSEKLVRIITTVRDTVREWPQDQSLPTDFVHRCSNFVNQLLTLQTGIDELVRQNDSWTRFLRTTKILDAIARYKEQITDMRSDFTLDVIIRIYMKGAERHRPRHLVHCFYILDATNKILHVPMDWCSSFNALENLIKYRFREHSGHEMIERGNLTLSLQRPYDIRRRLYKHNSDKWLPLIEPGITITMDIYILDKSYGKPNNPMCPSCHYPCARGSFGEYIEYARCETLVNNWACDVDEPLHVTQDTDEVATSESAILTGPLPQSNFPGNSSNLSAQGMHVHDNNPQDPYQFFRRFEVPSQVCHVLPSLHSAVWEKNSDTVRHLLEENADGNAAEDHHGKTPLHIAALHGHLDIAELLLNHNADVHARNSQVQTPLYLVAWFGHLNLVQYLFKHNADIHARALCGYLDIVELLLNHNADVNARDQWERTPLHVAAWRGRLDIVQFLLKHNADVHAKNCEGETPLDLATMGDVRPSKEVIRLLSGYMNASGW
ncbi:hypothetical protein H2248_002446 [Termitomyces sp. 'cryptogamus']|nr:hypothetical protein H2248_002446 [Termitomyces sp. 'cryptogamus']